MEPEGILHRARGQMHVSPPPPPPPPAPADKNSVELRASFNSGVADGIPESLVENGVEAEIANRIGGIEAPHFRDDDDDDDISAPKNASSSSSSSPDGIFFHDGFLSFTSRDLLVFPADHLLKYASRTKKLDLSFNRLVDAKGLESFVELEELMLDNNELTDDVNFPNLAKLATLSANNNKIADLDRFASMCRWKFPALRYLSLVGNDCCPSLTTACTGDEDDVDEYKRYRYAALYKIPTLKFLDFTPVSDVERAEATRRGKFIATVKVDEKAVDSLLASSAAAAAASAAALAAAAKKKGGRLSEEPEKEYAPLSSATRVDKEGGGGGGSGGGGGGGSATKEAYGKCRYVYYGKQSEGNRFIANDTL